MGLVDLAVYGLIGAFLAGAVGYIIRRNNEKELRINDLTIETISDEFIIRMPKSLVSKSYKGVVFYFVWIVIFEILIWSNHTEKLSDLDVLITASISMLILGGVGIFILYALNRNPVYRVNPEYIERISPESKQARVYWHEVEKVYPYPLLGEAFFLKSNDERMLISLKMDGVKHFLALLPKYLPSTKWEKMNKEVIKARRFTELTGDPRGMRDKPPAYTEPLDNFELK